MSPRITLSLLVFAGASPVSLAAQEREQV